LVVVVESMSSEDDMRALFRQEVKPRLARFAEVGAYNQEI
jgi:phosphomannomutase/phosphoglucomutase